MERFTTIVERTRAQFGEWFLYSIALLILFSIFFIAGGGVSQNPRWEIETIHVVGASTVSENVIREQVKEKLQGNYFFVYARKNSNLYPRKEIQAVLLDTFPRLASVETFRINAHTITVNVSERKPHDIWCGNEFKNDKAILDNCWFLDTTGFVFDRAPTFSSGVYQEVYGKLVQKDEQTPLRGIIPPDIFSHVDAFSRMLHSEVGEPLRVEIKKDEQFEIVIRSSPPYPFLSGVTIRCKDENDLVMLVKNLRAAIAVEFPENVALKKKLLYIDMRFGNKIFFGFEN